MNHLNNFKLFAGTLHATGGEKQGFWEARVN